MIAIALYACGFIVTFGMIHSFFRLGMSKSPKLAVLFVSLVWPVLALIVLYGMISSDLLSNED